MMILFGIFQLIVHIGSTQGTSQNIRCELEVVEDLYTCTIVSADVFNENNSIQFLMTHLGGKNDEDVIAMRTSLSFSGKIQIFHRQFLERFNNLQIIVLHNVDMISMAVNSFEKCNELVMLDVHSNILETVPDRIFENCSKLKALILSSNNLKSISNESFVGLNNLEVLNLNSNKVAGFSQNLIKNLITLKELDLGNPKSNFTYESTVLQHLKNLSVINLDNWNLKFENIKILIDKLTNLKKISIATNLLSDISFGFFNQFKVLEVLNMDNCSISSIPNNVLKEFPKIKEFSLRHNLFKSIIKKTFEKLGSLEVLKLGHNEIQDVDFKSFDIHFQLKELDLSNNNIKTLHADVFKYQGNLQKLDISSNGIETLAGLFKALEKLEVVDYSNNLIKRLNSGNLAFLREFSASFNAIEEIQRNFFVGFPNLEKVKFEGNPCADVIIENIQQTNVTSIFSQCFDNFEGITTSTTPLPTTTSQTSLTDIISSTTALISTDNPPTNPISTTISTTTLKKTTTVMTFTTTTSYFVPSTPSSTQSTTLRTSLFSSTMRTTTGFSSTTKGTGSGNVLSMSIVLVIFGVVGNLVL
ncbi:hypothetical protein ACKWTF_004118 [Chironomus riparius]